MAPLNHETGRAPKLAETGAHSRIVEAVVAGDVELAQKGMVRHLQVVTSWLA